MVFVWNFLPLVSRARLPVSLLMKRRKRKRIMTRTMTLIVPTQSYQEYHNALPYKRPIRQS